MLAKCTREFRDLEAGVVRKVGDTFEATPERLEAINGTKYGTLAEPVPDSAEKGAQKPADDESVKQAKPKPSTRRTRRTKSTGEE